MRSNQASNERTKCATSTHTDKVAPISLISCSLIALALTTALYLSSSTTSASTEVVDQVSLTVPTACTMSGTGTTHTATLNPGTYSGASGSEYENGIGKTTLTAICNDDNGFSIYAIGYTNNEYGTTTLIGQNTNTTIPTKAYESGDTTSNWSMKLTKVTNTSESYNPQNLTLTTSYDTWHAVPSEYTKVAQYHANTGSSTTDTTLGVKLETTYAAYISSNQPADTYTGQVKYTMVHPYDTATPQIPEAPSTSCTTPVPNYTYMQDINSANIQVVLSSMTEDSPYFLRDKRDNQPYCVAKLKDGKLWMTENLNIAGGTALSANDTDVAGDYINSFTTSNNLTKTGNTIVLPTSSTSGFGNENYSYVYNSGNKTSCGNNGQNTPCYSYYSWDAATLGSGRTIVADNTDAPYSICPKGWRLLKSGSDINYGWKRGDYYILATAYGGDLENSYEVSSKALYDSIGPGSTPNFILAGTYDSYGPSHSGSQGKFWSSTATSSPMYVRYVDIMYSSNMPRIRTAYSTRNNAGFSVRCLIGS